MGVELVAAVPELVDAVANAMRPADRAEVWASSHSRPAEALAQSIRRSRYTRAAIAGGQPACIFGVAAWSLTGDVGSPWLLGTGVMDRHGRDLLAMSRDQIAGLGAGFRLLENYVDCRNAASIRWLRWCGFEFDPPVPYGPDNLPFMRFEMRMNHV